MYIERKITKSYIENNHGLLSLVLRNFREKYALSHIHHEWK